MNCTSCNKELAFTQQKEETNSPDDALVLFIHGYYGGFVDDLSFLNQWKDEVPEPTPDFPPLPQITFCEDCANEFLDRYPVIGNDLRNNHRGENRGTITQAKEYWAKKEREEKQ